MKCSICDRSFNSFHSLGKHISGTHKIGLKDYYDNYLMVSDKDKYCICGNECSFINIRIGYLQYCGRKCGASNPDRKELIRNTSIIKYGVDSPNQSHDVKNKKIETFRKRYGVDNIFQLDECIDRNKKICIEKYGVDNYSKTEEYHVKTQSSNLLKYGVPYSLQNNRVREKSKLTHIKKYGVDNYSKTPRGKLISRITKIKSIENQLNNGEPLGPCIGTMERDCLNELQNMIDYEIIRNDPSFKYVVGRYPDGHIPQLKLFIQFDERHHFKDRLCKIYKQDDLDYTLQLASLGYVVFRISKRDWVLNKEKVLKDFQILKENLCLMIY